MKTKSKGAAEPDELRPAYDLGEILEEGVQGKYAERYREGTNLILLAPDVAEAFATEEAANEALRWIIRLRNLPSAEAKRKEIGNCP